MPEVKWPKAVNFKIKKFPPLKKGGKGGFFEEAGFEVEIIISDTGVGIPKDKLDKIFLPFYTTKPRGTGMGLALVHKIILSHGGNIAVESEAGKGTTFRIHLPCQHYL